jgi:uncharacterized membrane protein
MNQIAELLILSIIILVVDLGFLFGMRNYFNNQIRLIQGSDMVMNYLAAGLCYLVIIGCLYKFIIMTGASVFDAALLGWAIYLIYELTNKALFSKWSWTTVLMDGLWGGILFGVSAYIFRAIKIKF